MLYRRTFLGAALAVAASLAQAQEARRLPRIGVLWHASSVEEEGKFYTALVESLRVLGYEHGKTAQIEHRFPAEEPEKFEQFARDLVALRVDVLVAVTFQAAAAAKRATTTIPIVFVVVPDPVAAGLVTSLSAPGGNVTGFSNIATDLTARRLQLFKEVVGDLSRVALLVNPVDAVGTRRTMDDMDAAGARLGIAVVPFEVRARQELEPVLRQIAGAGFGGFAVAQNPVFFNDRKHIADIAIGLRLPSAHVNSDPVEAGFLMSYGANHEAIFRRTPLYVDRILKGARPRDLPVEQPTRFELVINLKTAKLIGVTIPLALLAQADQLVEG
jgi:putative tryptophan/tyrosine transport system substrate-binding protein